MQQKAKKAVHITLCVMCLTIGLILYINIANHTAIPSNNEDSPLEPMESTNPSSPVYLSDDSYDYEYYPDTTTNYYYSCDGYSYDYLLVWLYTYDYADDFDLYLYTDAAYSSGVATSMSGSQLDWVVYRPASSGYMYPKSYTYSGYGTAYIESETGYDLTFGSQYSFALSSSESGEIFEESLSTSSTYTVYLEVPSGCDFNVYVFRTASGSSSKLDLHSSVSTTTGYDERIVFTPTSTDTYAIVVTRISGSGTGYLTVYDYIYTPTRIPTFELFPALLALATIIFLYLTAFKKKNLFL